MEKAEIIDNLKDGRDIVKRLDDEKVYKDGAEWTAIMDLVSSYNRAIRVFERRSE